MPHNETAARTWRGSARPMSCIRQRSNGWDLTAQARFEQGKLRAVAGLMLLDGQRVGGRQGAALKNMARRILAECAR